MGWMEILGGVVMFLKELFKVINDLKPVPEDKHQDEAGDIRKEQEEFERTGRPKR